MCTMHVHSHWHSNRNGDSCIGGNLRYAYDLENFVVLIIIGTKPQPVGTSLVRRQGTMHLVLRKARNEQKDHCILLRTIQNSVNFLTSTRTLSCCFVLCFFYDNNFCTSKV